MLLPPLAHARGSPYFLPLTAMEDTAVSAGYRAGSEADSRGTYWYADIMVPPAAVMHRFGAACEGDEYKVSQHWVFRKGDLVFTLYDWKSTNLYESGLMSPEQFWACEEPMDLHVGSKEPATPEDAAAFAQWIENEVQQV